MRAWSRSIVEKCPFARLPESTSGKWGEGLAAADETIRSGEA